MDEKNEKQKKEAQKQVKETFEPLEMKVVDVKVEKGYATSGNPEPISINEWKNGKW